MSVSDLYSIHRVNTVNKSQYKLYEYSIGLISPNQYKNWISSLVPSYNGPVLDQNTFLCWANAHCRYGPCISIVKFLYRPCTVNVPYNCIGPMQYLEGFFTLAQCSNSTLYLHWHSTACLLDMYSIHTGTELGLYQFDTGTIQYLYGSLRLKLHWCYPSACACVLDQYRASMNII